jgi:hypothetical protein
MTALYPATTRPPGLKAPYTTSLDATQCEFAPGEVRNIRRQLARYGCFRSPGSSGVLPGATSQSSGGILERFAISAMQAQRIREQRDCCAPRMLNLAAFEIPDRPHTHARSAGELVL